MTQMRNARIAPEWDLVAGLSLEHRIALAYAPRAVRQRFASLLALHRRCETIVRRARDPLPAQFRLAWHRGILSGEAAAGRPNREMAAIMTGWDEDPSSLVPVIDAWEEVLCEAANLQPASQAAARPFRLIAGECGCEPAECEAVAQAGERWTGIVLGLAAQSTGGTAVLPDTTDRIALPRAMRPLAVLDGLARRAARQGHAAMMGDRLSPFAAIRLGILGR